VGLTVNGHHTTVLSPDRGGRQHLKIMQLLAAVEADGATPLAETLIATLPRLRRGMSAVVVTPSLERDWVRPLSTLRPRGVGCVVVSVDPHSHAIWPRRPEAGPAAGAPRAGSNVPGPGADNPSEEAAAQRARALRHALAEYELPTYVVTAGRPLAEALAG